MKSEHIKRISAAFILVIVIILFQWLDLGRFASLEFLKSSQERFNILYSENPALVIGVYMLIYVVSTALSLPGAAVLTLAGGALFGLVTGVIIVSFASSAGAVLACSISRYILRSWVQAKAGDRLDAINIGIEKEGAFYLFALRLVPVFPFWLINLAMGLTKMPLWRFYWVSQAGMLAGTIVYVNAGKELGKIESLSGLLSPSLIISFIILGIFPLTVKRILSFYRKSRTGPENAEISDG